MQTFLPYSDFILSAKCLDYKRLGKQRVEAFQILKSLRTNSGWINHPATKMWRGYECSLTLYMNEMIREWISRGYNNSMVIELVSHSNPPNPTWFGDERLHSSHRSNLLRKDPEYYKKWNWTEVNNMPYFWPQ